MFRPIDERRGAERQEPRKDWSTRAKSFKCSLGEDRLNELAINLGVQADALTRIGVGWDTVRRRYTFPERDGNGHIIGIATRKPNGNKVFMKGGFRGLTIPDDFEHMTAGPVLIVEGPTDVAAGLTLGLKVVGRPSCNGGVKHLSKLLDGRDVLIVGEFDMKSDGKWPGRDGAKSIAEQLARRWGTPVRWALPPDKAKDIRAWLNLQSLNLDDDTPCRAAGRKLIDVLRSSSVVTEGDLEDSSGQDNYSSDDDDGSKPTQSAMLVDLATDVEFFHSGDSAYATYAVGDHRETCSVQSKGLRLWLMRRFYRANDKPPNAQAMQDALGILSAKALFDGPEMPVGVRLAEHDGVFWLDLADADWQAVRIDASGWQVVANPSVKFVRPRGLLPLPQPVAGGSVRDLRPFVNVRTEEEWVLLLAWLVASLRPVGPYPVLIINGEQGSAKSTLCRMLRSLIDPNLAPLRAQPRDERDLMIAATNSWLICLDNLSHIGPWLSDSICRLATGGGFATRELYTDDEEKLFDAMRPVLANGIEEIVTRGDLQDRTINLTLQAIPDVDRRAEKDLWIDFEAIRPRLLGALLDAVSAAIRNLPSVKLAGLPRMADFAAWVVAAEPALELKPGAFMAAYAGNRAAAVEMIVESAAIGPAIFGIMHGKSKWEGTAKVLLASLEDHHSDEKTRKRRDWPKSPAALGNSLRRLVPALRKMGIATSFTRESGRRVITIERAGDSSSSPSSVSQVPLGSTESQIEHDGNDEPHHQRRHSETAEIADSGPPERIDDGDDGNDDVLQRCSVAGDVDDWGEV